MTVDIDLAIDIQSSLGRPPSSGVGLMALPRF